MHPGQAPKNKQALEKRTGILWHDWLEFLEPYRQLNHSEMVKKVYPHIVKAGRSKSPEWWSQGVVVAYEQHIGRRSLGQTCDGNYSVTVTKTYDGDMEAVLARWSTKTAGATQFDGVKLTSVPRQSQTEKWRYWRCDLVDGSKLSVNIQTKPDGHKSMLAINHDKLSRSEDVERWRAFWKAFA